MFWNETTYRLWTCSGCDTGTLELAETNDSWTDENDNQQYSYSYWPERQINALRKKLFRKLPLGLRTIYSEVIDAFNKQLHLLCAAGLRALIEGICDDKQIVGSTLEKRIDALTTILPENIVKNLHSFRFLGNSALHQLSKPKQADLRLAIEVSEDLLNFLYELDYKASRLHQNTAAVSPKTPAPVKPEATNKKDES
jgi:hypothetical protein